MDCNYCITAGNGFLKSLKSSLFKIKMPLPGISVSGNPFSVIIKGGFKTTLAVGKSVFVKPLSGKRYRQRFACFGVKVNLVAVVVAYYFKGKSAKLKCNRL